MSSLFRRNSSQPLFLCTSCALLGSCSQFGKGRKQDTLRNHAITCSTVMPVDFYGRRLTPDDESDPLHVACNFEILQEDA
ncbi:unnamed protein product, partial [Ectocarpus sp. 8 AP-2014]